MTGLLLISGAVGICQIRGLSGIPFVLVPTVEFGRGSSLPARLRPGVEATLKTPEVVPESLPETSQERLFYVVVGALGRALFIAGAFWLVIGGLGACWIVNQSRPGMNPVFRTDTSEMPGFLGFAFQAFLVTAVLLCLLDLVRMGVVWARNAGRRT